MLCCQGEGHQSSGAMVSSRHRHVAGFTADHPPAVSVESEMLFLGCKDAGNFVQRQHDATWKPSTFFFLTTASRQPWPKTASGSDEGCSQVM